MIFTDVGGIKRNGSKISKYSSKISIVNPDALVSRSKKVVCQICSVLDANEVHMVRSNSPMEDDNWHCPRCGNVMVRHGSGYSDPEIAPGDVSIEAVNDISDPDNQPKMKSVSKFKKPDIYEDPEYVRKDSNYDRMNIRKRYPSAMDASRG